LLSSGSLIEDVIGTGVSFGAGLMKEVKIMVELHFNSTYSKAISIFSLLRVNRFVPPHLCPIRRIGRLIYMVFVVRCFHSQYSGQLQIEDASAFSSVQEHGSIICTVASCKKKKQAQATSKGGVRRVNKLQE
jgi:hypothetical protein